MMEDFRQNGLCHVRIVFLKGCPFCLIPISTEFGYNSVSVFTDVMLIGLWRFLLCYCFQWVYSHTRLHLFDSRAALHTIAHILFVLSHSLISGVLAIWIPLGWDFGIGGFFFNDSRFSRISSIYWLVANSFRIKNTTDINVRLAAVVGIN